MVRVKLYAIFIVGILCTSERSAHSTTTTILFLCKFSPFFLFISRLDFSFGKVFVCFSRSFIAIECTDILWVMKKHLKYTSTFKFISYLVSCSLMLQSFSKLCKIFQFHDFTLTNFNFVNLDQIFKSFIFGLVKLKWNSAFN